MKPLVVQVPPGIGDISWVYSKLVSLGRPLRFIVPANEPRRAGPYLDLLPAIDSWQYDEQLDGGWVIQNGDRWTCTPEWLMRCDAPVPLQVNTHLERGRRIEAWIPGLGTRHHYEMRIPRKEEDAARHYLEGKGKVLAIYTSSFTTARAWHAWEGPQWAEFCKYMVDQWEFDAVAVLGAPWDKDLGGETIRHLHARRLPVIDLLGKLNLGGSLSVIKRSRYFVAFPSGLPILTVVMGEPVFMFYPDRATKPAQPLQSMPWTFAPLDSIAEARYLPHFWCPPREAFDRIAWSAWGDKLGD